METNLPESDINRIAAIVVELIARRLSSPVPQVSEATKSGGNIDTQLPERLAYSRKELAAELNLSPVPLWRLETKGLIKPVPGVRHKMYSNAEVNRFLSGKNVGWK